MKIILTPVAAAAIIAAATSIHAAPTPTTSLAGVADTTLQNRTQLDAASTTADFDRRANYQEGTTKLITRGPTVEELVKGAEVVPSDAETTFEVIPGSIDPYGTGLVNKIKNRVRELMTGQSKWEIRAKEILEDHYKTENSIRKANGEPLVKIPRKFVDATPEEIKPGDTYLVESHSLASKPMTKASKNIETIAEGLSHNYKYSTHENRKTRYYQPLEMPTGKEVV